nr:MAG TPA: hypothetical protein [Caudoviricetes sp.]
MGFPSASNPIAFKLSITCARYRSGTSVTPCVSGLHVLLPAITKAVYKSNILPNPFLIYIKTIVTKIRLRNLVAVRIVPPLIQNFQNVRSQMGGYNRNTFVFFVTSTFFVDNQQYIHFYHYLHHPFCERKNSFKSGCLCIHHHQICFQSLFVLIRHCLHNHKLCCFDVVKLCGFWNCDWKFKVELPCFFMVVHAHFCFFCGFHCKNRISVNIRWIVRFCFAFLYINYYIF